MFASRAAACLDAVAVRGHAVDAARLVRVEEVLLVVILVVLPLVEGEAKDKGDDQEDEEERVIVDTEGLWTEQSDGARGRGVSDQACAGC